MEGNNARDDSENVEEILETQDQERESANIWREAMAEEMWKDATTQVFFITSTQFYLFAKDILKINL